MNQVKKVISPREAGRILGRGTATLSKVCGIKHSPWARASKPRPEDSST